YGNMLEKNLGNASLSRFYIQKILKSAERATHLVQGLLAFSRKQGSSQNPVPINRIMLEVKTLLSRLIGENIVLNIVPAKKDCVVMADCGQMEQVLINLATNARDAMPRGGTLTITTEVIELDDVFIKVHGYGEIGKYVLISVKDTGMGIDKETLRRIFQPFFTTKEVGKGTGLGLSIVYGIIKQHGGYINVESELGKGATFRIYLPVITKSTAEEGKPTPLPAYLSGTEMILVAEDEEDVRTLAKSLLEEAGYKVIAAVDGYDTINKFIENKDNINLLLLDVIMPTKNGREAYEEIRKIRTDIKALFMSGYSESVIHKITVLKEGFHFISKPFSQTALLKKVREILDNE
ncbi:MAG: ATP-binding protein, partial [Candidatus Brocadiaceae bacterium]|nr:ATP-binding protein [Candidatus Brocadiaceae bacterium]